MIESDAKQIKKGILKILILKLLQGEKKYGYELLVEMSRKSSGFFKVKEGTLYPILYKLEEDGFVVSEWQIPHDKMRAKKYYSITQKGKKELKELIQITILVFVLSRIVKIISYLKNKKRKIIKKKTHEPPSIWI